MSVAGIDLSTRCLDIVLLDDDRPHAEWHRVELDGKDAWERTLRVREEIRLHARRPWSVWDGVRHVAIEAPYGSGQPGTLAVLNRVVGAVVSALPAELRDPARCWVVRPDEWKHGLGLKTKPDDLWMLENAPIGWELEGWTQDAKDAFCLALWTQRTLDAATAPRSGAPSPAETEAA